MNCPACHENYIISLKTFNRFFSFFFLIIKKKLFEVSLSIINAVLKDLSTFPTNQMPFNLISLSLGISCIFGFSFSLQKCCDFLRTQRAQTQWKTPRFARGPFRPAGPAVHGSFDSKLSSVSPTGSICFSGITGIFKASQQHNIGGSVKF